MEKKEKELHELKREGKHKMEKKEKNEKKQKWAWESPRVGFHAIYEFANSKTEKSNK